MKDTTYYATPGQVQSLAIQRHNENKPHISFPDGLAELMHMKQLATKKPPEPKFKSNMTAEEFDAYFLSTPLNANKILKHAPYFYSDSRIDESELFPYQNDVFCFKHLPYMNEAYHMHEYFEVTILYKGTYKLLFENESVTLTEGDLCIIPPKCPHNQPIDPSSFAIGISIRKSTFDKVFGSLLLGKDLVSNFFRDSLYGSHRLNYLRMKTEMTPRLCSIIQQLAFEGNQNDLYANSCCVSLLNVFFNLVLRNYSDTITFYDDSIFSQKDFDFAHILQFVQQNYQVVTLSSLAKVFHFSEAYMSKLFTRHLGKSFSSVLLNVRMEKAIQYLNHSDYKIYKIAELIGYSSVDHFSRAFKQAYGVTPKTYQLENNRAISE